MSFELQGDLPFPLPGDIDQQVAEVMPERCADCGVQCELGTQLARMLVVKHMMTRAAESLVGESGELFDSKIDETAPAEITDQIKRAARSSTASKLDEIDQDIEDITGEINNNSLLCKGPLKMRASKEGVMYTVSVCTSAGQCDDGLGHLPTHIKRHPNSQ